MFFENNKNKGVRAIKEKIFTALFVLITAITVVYITVPQEKAAASTEYVSNVDEQASYTLKDYKGKLALFREDAEIPYKIFDVFTSNLPKKDREALKDGIKAVGEKELQKLISDYTS